MEAYTSLPMPPYGTVTSCPRKGACAPYGMDALPSCESGVPSPYERGLSRWQRHAYGYGSIGRNEGGAEMRMVVMCVGDGGVHLPVMNVCPFDKDGGAPYGRHLLMPSL